jgi:hypothetical protein
VAEASGAAGAHAGSAAPEASVVVAGEALGLELESDWDGAAEAEEPTDGGALVWLGPVDGAVEVGPQADMATISATRAKVQVLRTRRVCTLAVATPSPRVSSRSRCRGCPSCGGA